MLSRTKKVILSLLLSVFLLANLSTSFVHAQTWYNQSYDDWYEKVHNTEQATEIFGERYTRAQVQWVIYSLIAIITTVDEDLQSCIAREGGLTRDCSSEFWAAVCKMSANLMPDAFDDELRGLCVTASGIGELFEGILSHNNVQNNWHENPLLATISKNPISSITYFKDLQSRLKLVPEAQAQGFGFTAVNPMLNLWRKVRDLTYFLLVIVVIVMAFMIMFRMRLSPQTVISVQSALPKIVMALILITFSYAIAGFLIDLMYVVIGLLAAILTSTSGGAISSYDWSEMFRALTEKGVLHYTFLYWIWFMPAMFAALVSSGWFGATVGMLIAGFLSPIILLVVAIALLVVQIKIAWLLFRTFVNILFLVILGPIQILLGTFAGGGFKQWMKTILSHLAIYPTVGFMFVMSFVFLRGAFTQIDWLSGPLFNLLFPLDIQQQFPPGGAWDPPFTFGSSGLELGYLGASFIILSMIPKAGKMMKAFIMGGRFEMGSEIGQAVGAPLAVGMTPVTRPIEQTYAAYRKYKTDLRGKEIAEKGFKQYFQKVLGRS